MSLRASIFLLPTFFLCGFLGLFAHVARCRCCQKRKCWITFLRWSSCPSVVNDPAVLHNSPASPLPWHAPHAYKRTNRSREKVYALHWLTTYERSHCAHTFSFAIHMSRRRNCTPGGNQSTIQIDDQRQICGSVKPCARAGVAKKRVTIGGPAIR